MLRQFFLLVFILLPLLSCSIREEQFNYPYDSRVEKETLEKFFRHLLFWERGVYTLLGSKPITAYDIYERDDSYPPRLECFQLPDSKIYLNKDRKEDISFYKSLDKGTAKKAILLSDRDYVFDGALLMKGWDAFKSKIHISPNYILFKLEYSSEEKEELSSDCKTAYHVVFVNVVKTACLLNEHYDLFAKILGKNFDPIEEVLKINSLESPILALLHSQLPEKYYREIGLLLGYGSEASQVFEWSNGTLASSNAVFEGIYKEPTNDMERILRSVHPLSAQNFPLPSFVSYSHTDPMKRKYLQERKEIMEFYADRDFVDTTLDVLTGQLNLEMRRR